MAKSVEASSRSNKEKSLLRKLAPSLGLLAISAIVSLGAYSEKQKAFIKERDGDSCQFPGEHDCGGKLIIHQIKPPAYSKEEGLDPDYAENGLTICSNAQKLIYSDLQQIPRDGVGKVMKQRGIKLKQGRPYWNAFFDRPMSTRATINTQRAKADGQEFPTVKRRKKSE
jgi:hypothetical protein